MPWFPRSSTHQTVGEQSLQTVTDGCSHVMHRRRTSDGPGAMLTLHDITEMKRLQKLRSDFVANVTHELKTPLTSIRLLWNPQGRCCQRPKWQTLPGLIDIEPNGCTS